MRKKIVSREQVLAAIRKAFSPAPAEWDKRKKGLAIRAFFAKSGLRPRDVYRHFATWNEALKAAGGDVPAHRTYMELEELLADWGMVARKVQRPPPYTVYNVHGKFCARTLQVRFGSWSNVAGAFKEFAKGKEEWADVLTLCDVPLRGQGDLRIAQRPARVDTMAKTKVREDRPVYGEPLELLPLRNAPTNENGVILVFGMLAAQLGFHIQAVRTAFPDCDALRRVGPEGWQNVTIEFEFQSCNFHRHGHPPNGCDLIVCWVHNWADCPPNLEVIALRDIISKCDVAAE